MWDLPNLLVCLAVIFAAFTWDKIKLSHAICLVLISFLPYCLNYIVFNPGYMPDQFTYWSMVSSIRDFSYNSDFYNSRVTEASYMYAFLPLPFIETVNSLGFFNKFLMILIFIWTSSVLKLRGWILWFLLLYPSLLLYSSLGLRDMMICSLMLLALWSLIRGWYLLTVIFIGALIEIKMQNALLVILFSFGYILDKVSNFHFTRKKLLNLLLVFFVLAYITYSLLINKIEFYRFHMFLENGGYYVTYHPIQGFFDFLYQGAFGILRALFYPFPWDAEGFFQIIQALENIGVAVLLFVFTWNSYKIIPKQTLMWLFFLLSSMLMNGVVVSNVGTMVRYKLPFIIVYLILLSYERVRYKRGWEHISE